MCHRRQHGRDARVTWLVVFLLLAPGLARAGEPSSDSFDAHGVKLHYLVQGAGEPVILIHGLYASADINWVKPGIFSALAKDHQVIALDMPGHGLSDKPEAADAYGKQMAEDVVLLMDHLKLARAHIVGYSMGGMVAMKLIATHPDRALSCVLGGMGWLREGSPLQKTWEQMRVRREGGRVPAACVHGFAELAVTEEQVKPIQLPVLILIGDRDPVKRLYVAPLQAVRGDWPTIEIKDAGHLNCIVKPQFTEEIVKWVAEHAAKS